MKVMAFQKYGSPETLKLKEIEKPVPKDNELLIKVHACSVNSWDWDLLKGTPLVNRMMFGWRKPKITALGCDIAGVVEETGSTIKAFKKGDQVFGDISRNGWSGFAEYVCVSEDSLTVKPSEMTFEVAASLPQAAAMAVQSLYDKIKIKPGQKILVNGAGGGVGTIVVQLARHLGAEITAVDKEEKFDLLRSLGADHCIDYKKEDFSKKGEKYDLIIDVVGKHSIFELKKVLNPKGVYRMVGGSASLIFQLVFLGPLISRLSGRKLGILVHEPNKHMKFLLELIASGKVVPIVDRTYQLEQLPQALWHLGEGKVQGKVVVTI
ncbi:zinc-binding dehydrogenase [Leptobacterium flavescens]|uniref:Zinc-binding dehydrogenase n=2 Tax=Leptobacterium flavescens TaxID=472055 RepID=A0A6P0UPT7_9FLAO|nr:zinc-binding dehydrogenase [Leptobacterium flavescens]